MMKEPDWQKRIFLFLLFLLSASVVVCTVLAEKILTNALWAQAREFLSIDMEKVRAAVEEGREGLYSTSGWDELADQLGSRLMVRVSFITPQGKVLGDSHVERGDLEKLDDHSNRPEIRKALEAGTGCAVRYSETMGVDSFYLASLWGKKEEGEIVIRLATQTPLISQAKRNLRWAAAGIFLFGLAFSFFAGRFLAKAIGKNREELLRKDLEEICLSWQQAFLDGERESALLARNLGSRIQEEIVRLKETRDRLNAILDGMAEGVMLLDSKGKIELVNQALLQLMGPIVNPLGQSPAEAYRLASLQEEVDKCRERDEPSFFELELHGPVPKVLEVRLSPIGGSGVVGVFRDVTEKKRTEEMRKNLVAHLSHELRTPLTAIKGSVESLLDGGFEDCNKAQKFLDLIHRQVLRMEKMVKDLLHLSRLEAMGYKPELVDCRLGELALKALEAVRPMAEVKGLDIQCSILHPEATVRGNPTELHQAVVNLLDNAIQFTEKGRVILRGELVEDEVHLCVEDTGIGIPREHLPRIFERFYRVDRHRSRERGGSGLGLSIVKHIVQNHGGRIEVESTPGQGSKFRLIFPGGFPKG